MKRTVALMMAVLLLVVFCACEVQQTPVSPDVSHTDNKTDQTWNRLDELESVDFGGRTFRIAIYQSDTVFPENTDTPLGRALSERNAMVEEKYHVKLKNVSIPREDFAATIRSAYENGEDLFDIVIAPRSMAAVFITSDMLMNVNSLPYINYNKSYYDAEAMRAATIGSVTYEIAGDLLTSPGLHWAVCYNIELASQFPEFGDFVSLANNNQWTWENFYKYVNLVREDLNDDSVMTDADRFGYTSSAGDETLAKILWASGGIEFFSAGENGELMMDFGTDLSKVMINTIQDVLQTPGRYSEEEGTLSALDLFVNGQSLFYICPASTLSYLQFQGMNVGMLPLPKLTEDQAAFGSYVDSNAQAVYVLNNCADTEFVGRIVHALFAASEGIIRENAETVYTSYLTGDVAVKYFKEMLDHGYYDPAFVLGSAIPKLQVASWRIVSECVFNRGDFDTLYESQEKIFNGENNSG